MIWSGRLGKEDSPNQCRWASSNLLRAWIEQKSRGRAYLLIWAGTSTFCPQTSVFLVLGLLNSDWDLKHWSSCSQASGFGWNYITSFLGPQPASGTAWGFSGSMIRNKSLSIYIYIFYWSCFSGESWLIHNPWQQTLQFSYKLFKTSEPWIIQRLSKTFVELLSFRTYY